MVCEQVTFSRNSCLPAVLICSMEQKNSRITPWLWLAIGAAVVLRGWIYLRTPFSPGMNGAYYLVQARSILEKGTLGIPDMPLTFTLHALFAWVIQLLGVEQATAISFAVKMLDSLLPPLVGLPVYLLARRWPGASAITAVAAAAAACCGVHALTMVGDFEKNALALMWLGWLAWALHSWVGAPCGRTAWPVVLFATLLGLTHVGTLGAACGFSGLVVLLALALVAREQRGAVVKLLLISALAVGAGVALVYTFFDEERAVRLVRALSDPSTIEDSKRGGMPGGARMGGGGMMMGMGGMGRGGPGFGPGGFGPGGMDMAWMRYLPHGSMLFCGTAALLLAWLKRRTLSAASMTIICAAALTALVLGGPWWNSDKGMRFILIAGLPCCIAASWVAAAVSQRWLRGIWVALLFLYAAASLGHYAQSGPRPMMSEEARDELLAMKKLVPPGSRSLIVARHGLEWWVSWFVGTRIAQPSGVEGADWKDYEAVYYITEKRSPGGMPGGMPGGRGSRGGGPMRGPEAPSSAQTVYDGQYYSLAWVKEVPEQYRPEEFLSPWW